MKKIIFNVCKEQHFSGLTYITWMEESEVENYDLPVTFKAALIYHNVYFSHKTTYYSQMFPLVIIFIIFARKNKTNSKLIIPFISNNHS